MDKFEDINAGDKVLIIKKAGGFSRRSFYCLTAVDRVTPKMFFCDGKKYRKSDGKEIGGGYSDYAHKVGGNIKDQTDDLVEYNRRQRTVFKINKTVNDIISNIHVNHKNLKEIKKLSEKIADLL